MNLENTDGAGDGEGDSPLSIQATTVSVLADGTATALSNVGKQSNISLKNAVVSLLTAKVTALQKAQLNRVNVVAGTVTVESQFNNGEAQGAVAVLGSATTGFNVKISASEYSAEVNVLKAEMAGTSMASVTGADITATGAVAILSDAKSYAKAYTEETIAYLGLVNVGAVSVEAKANGIFAAKVKSWTC